MTEKIKSETRLEHRRKIIEQAFKEYASFPDEEGYNNLSKLLIGYYVKDKKVVYEPKGTFIYYWALKKGIPEDEIKDFCWQLFTDIMLWLKGQYKIVIDKPYGKEEILKPYRKCWRKEGEAFGNFQRYLFNKINDNKRRRELESIQSDLGREIRKDKDGEAILLHHKITYSGFDLKNQVVTWQGQKPSLNNDPMEMYIGKETREELFVKASVDIQEEAWKQAGIEARIKSEIIHKRYPEIWTYLQTLNEDDPIWEVFAIVDEDRFIILCDRLAGIGFFPKEKDIITTFQVRQLDKLLEASKSHDLIKTEKKIKQEEDSGDSYEYVQSLSAKENMGHLQFLNKRLNESSGRWSVRRMAKILTGLGYPITHKTLKKRLDKFKEARKLLDEIDMEQRGLTKAERIEERWLNSLFNAILFTKLKEKAIEIRRLKREAAIGKFEPIDEEKEIKIKKRIKEKLKVI